MPIYVLSNIPSIRAQRNLGITQRALNTTLERLATGKRINRASDDPAGLLLSSKETKSIVAWNQGAENMRLGLDMLNTADSFTTIILEDLQRLNELANAAKNGLISDEERALLDLEFQQIIPEIDRLGENTQFLGRTLLGGGVSVEVQAGEGINNVITVRLKWISAGASGGLTSGAAGGLAIDTLSIDTLANASNALTTLSRLSFPRIHDFMSRVGAQSAAFIKSVDATDALVENLTAARDRILLADLAEETTNLTNNQIIVQSGISALVNANAAQTLALALLGG
jgi:flagellin